MCTYPRIFLMSLLCSINCDRLQVHANISFLWKRVWTVQAALRNPLGVSICSFEKFQNIWFFNVMHTLKKSISVCVCFKNLTIYEGTSSVSALSWAFWELLFSHVSKSRMSCTSILIHPSYFKTDFGFSGVSVRCNRSINVKLPCS